MNGYTTGLEVISEYRGQAAVIRLRGSAGTREAPIFLEALRGVLPRQVPLVVIDLHRLDYMGREAMQVLDVFRRLLLRQHGRVVLAGLSTSLRSLLAAEQIDGLFPKVWDVETALARAAT
jgi:anti-anti-sigma factor